MLCEACGWLTMALEKGNNALQRKSKENNFKFILLPLPKNSTTNDKNKILMQIRWDWSTFIFKALEGTYSSQSPSYEYKTLNYGNNVFTRWVKAVTYVVAAILVFTELYHILAHAFHSSHLVHYSLLVPPRALFVKNSWGFVYEISICFASHWFRKKKWREIFKLITERANHNREIIFGSH